MARIATLTGFLLTLLQPLAGSAQTEQDYVPSLRLLLEVRDAETNEPLVGAHVGVDTLLRVTNLDGQALYRGLGKGPLTVGAAFVGYAAADTVIDLQRSVRMVFMLQPQAFNLAAAEVEAEKFNTARLNRVGFFDRRDVRTGVFFTINDIEKRGATQLSDVFRGLNGLRMEMQDGRTYLTSTRTRGCSPSFYLDGTHARDLEEFVDSVSLRDVLAIEVYRGPSEVPVEFTATINGAECGTILVWTRAR